MVGLISAFPYRFRQKTAVLIAIMGMMLVQCVVIVFAIHFQLWSFPKPHNDITDPIAWLFQLLFGLDLRLAEIGVPVAICIGAYTLLVKPKLNLSRTLPNLTFIEPPQELNTTAARLAEAAEIQPPEVSLIDTGAPTAFTVHTRGKYIIAVSVGLIESFDPREVEACVAHEISHIKNRDFTLRAIVTAARIALFTRLLSYFVESAFYRTRELLADKTACLLMGSTRPLISALTKLQDVTVASQEITGAMTCCFNGRNDFFGLLNKHPDLRTRIGALIQLESTWMNATHFSYVNEPNATAVVAGVRVILPVRWRSKTSS